MKYTIKYGDLISTYYTNNNSSVVIRAGGFPSISSDSALMNPEIFLENGYDIIIPEYYGFCRSGGVFTPQNCVNTVLDIYDLCSKGGSVINIFGSDVFDIGYSEVYLLGVSFGGAITSIVPKFNGYIKKIGLICPVLDYKGLGEYSESTVDDVYKLMGHGYVNLYNGFYDNELRNSYFSHKDDYHPLSGIDYLNDVDMFIAHGKKDLSVNYNHTLSFISKIKTEKITLFIDDEANHKGILDLGLLKFVEFLKM